LRYLRAIYRPSKAQAAKAAAEATKPHKFTQPWTFDWTVHSEKSEAEMQAEMRRKMLLQEVAVPMSKMPFFGPIVRPIFESIAKAPIVKPESPFDQSKMNEALAAGLRDNAEFVSTGMKSLHGSLEDTINAAGKFGDAWRNYFLDPIERSISKLSTLIPLIEAASAGYVPSPLCPASTSKPRGIAPRLTSRSSSSM
jgi:hypothetical protein